MNKKRKDDEWRRDFDELFGSGDMDEIFEAMRQQMDRMMESMMSGELDAASLKPYVSGFSMRVGPDGQPHFERFGTTDRPTGEGPEAGGGSESREPLTDVIETDESLAITVEVPGVEKKDVDLEVVDDVLVISVDTDVRRYFKEIRLPCAVEPESAKATYNNGVLDITLKKVCRQKKGTKIAVE